LQRCGINDPNYQWQFYTNNDASGIGICAVLTQNKGGLEKLIYLYSSMHTKFKGKVVQLNKSY
jgi:hypothetical protein